MSGRWAARLAAIVCVLDAEHLAVEAVEEDQCRASSAICEARKMRWSSVGAAIANGSSSVVTRSSPMKNERHADHCMNAVCSS